MKVTIDITEQIKVRIAPQPKKNKKCRSTYEIYLLFTITQNGIAPFSPPSISTGRSLPIADWDIKHKQMKGRKGDLFNSNLALNINRARLHLEKFRVEQDVRTCNQVRGEIQQHIKPSITGHAPRGKKGELTARQKQLTVDAVLADLLRVMEHAKDRSRNYAYAISFLHRFFNYNTPLITNISELDLYEFRKWMLKQNKRNGEPYASDTITTWCTMVAAVFKHAHKPMELIDKAPLPDGFRGAFLDHEDIEILSLQDCKALLGLDPHQLSEELQASLYCLWLQLSTGIAYCDILKLKREHIKFDSRLERWQLQKERCKTIRNPQPSFFKVPLTPRAKYAYDQLTKLTGTAEKLFELPTTINGINKNYKAIGKIAGLQTHFTTYTLRHTFSVDYMDNKGTLEDLGELLGNDYRSTRKYGRISNKRLDESMQEVQKRSILHKL